MAVSDDFDVVEKVVTSQDDIDHAVVLEWSSENAEAQKAIIYYVPQGYVLPQWDVLMKSINAETGSRVKIEKVMSLRDVPFDENGTLDRAQLTGSPEEVFEKYGYCLPEGDIEIKIAKIWSNVLKAHRIDRRDNFFRLGGSSVLAVRVIVKMQAEFGKAVSIETFFQMPTVERLAAALSSSDASDGLGGSFSSGSI